MRLIDAENFEVLSWKATDNQDYNDGFNDGVIFVTEKIDNAPTIDVMPVTHGRWIKMTGMMPPKYHGHYQCSECQWHMKGLRNSWTREEELSYCPNCGAKMINEE